MPARKTSKKRGAWARRGLIYGAAADQLVKDVKSLKNLVNVEMKLVRSNFTIGPTYAGYMQSLVAGIAQGDLQGERDGSSIKLQSFKFRGRVINAPGVNGTIRFILYRERASCALAINELLDPAQVGTSNAPFALKDWANRHKSTFLYDRTITINPHTASSTHIVPLRINKTIRTHVQFDPAATTVASGDLRVLVITDNVAVNQMKVEGMFEIKWVDN